MSSPLAKVLPSAKNEEELRKIKLQAWKDHGILVVRADEATLGWVQREQVRQLGEFLYGKRG